MASGCQATTKDGQPCSAYVRPGDRYCRWHDPARAEERLAWSQRGGRNKSNKRRAQKDLADAQLTMPEIGGLLSVAMRAVLSGKLEPGRAQAMASLARAIATTKAAGEFEERLALLEERANAQGGRSA